MNVDKSVNYHRLKGASITAIVDTDLKLNKLQRFCQKELYTFGV